MFALSHTSIRIHTRARTHARTHARTQARTHEITTEICLVHQYKIKLHDIVYYIHIFWEELDEVLQSIPDKEGLMVIGDFNDHVGMERTYLKRWHGGHSYGILNDEGIAILQCALMYDLAICNTFFQKKDEHMITYRSGTRQSTI